MSEGENQTKNEVIIIKRHAGGEGEHHGSAWKIAYADFMTAMMAFFLVMWLVNAANEETKASVASYFNPIKLTDDKPADKSLKKPGKQAEGEDTQEKSRSEGEKQSQSEGAEKGKDQSTTAGEEVQYSQADFFENPYSVLSEIAQEVGQQANVSAKGDGGAADSGPATGAAGGEAYRDPFDPDFWTQQVEISQATSAGSENVSKLGQGKETDTAAAKPDDAEKKDVAEAAAKAADEADKLQKEIAQNIASLGKLADGLTVTPAEGGLLVSLTDQMNSAMFNVGSALPKKELVIAMEKIGKILAERKGAITVRGHTDARPFKGNGDNWQLSAARAQSAYYMLVRGGLDEKRVGQVSGFADRRPKVPEDPLADANRRIEILIQATEG